MKRKKTMQSAGGGQRCPSGDDCRPPSAAAPKHKKAAPTSGAVCRPVAAKCAGHSAKPCACAAKGKAGKDVFELSAMEYLLDGTRCSVVGNTLDDLMNKAETDGAVKVCFADGIFAGEHFVNRGNNWVWFRRDPRGPVLKCAPEEEAKLRADAINHPPHYTSHKSGVECITITEHMTFNIGNAVKYPWRADLKDDRLENLRKARWFVDREIQRVIAMRKEST